MYDVPLLVHENVAVVTVLDLKNVGDDGVGSHALDEVTAGGLEGEAVLWAVLGNEVGEEGAVDFLSQLVTRHRVWNEFDDATPRFRCDYFVWEQVYIQ